MKRYSALVWIGILIWGAVTVRADIVEDDVRAMGLLLRNQYGAYAQRDDADPRVKALVDSYNQNASLTQRYQLLAEALAIVNKGGWNESIEVATIMDMTLPGKVFEPGDVIDVQVEPLYERKQPISGVYSATVKLTDFEDTVLDGPATVPLPTLESRTAPLNVPADLAGGRYLVEYSIQQQDSPEPIIQGKRSLFVVPGLKRRLATLEAQWREIQTSKVADQSPRHALASAAVQWHLDMYRQARRQSVETRAFGGGPIFVGTLFGSPGPGRERMDFAEELELAEELAGALVRNQDPLLKRTGDMHLAYVSPVDGEFSPFRIFVPSHYEPANAFPLVVVLHGGGGDENGMLDGHGGLVKKNAERRGYVVVSPSGRGPFGAYRGKSGQDVLDVLDLTEQCYSIDPQRIYMTGHSMGGMGTISLGFDHPHRFAALAASACFRVGRALTGKLANAKSMPLFMAQGDQDTWEPVEDARAFYDEAKKLGMPHLKYVEKAGAKHNQIYGLVLDDIFDWFDTHTKRERRVAHPPGEYSLRVSGPAVEAMRVKEVKQ
jgi:predicted esterase